MQEPEGHDRLLTEALRALADDDARRGASPRVEARLLAEVRAIAQARRQAYAKVFAIAAGLVLAVALPVWQVAKRPPAPPQASGGAEEVSTEFFPLTYSTVPVTGGHLVRMEVSETVMASFGIQTGRDPMDTVLADVVIGEDGLARAVSFVLTPPQEDLQ